jgi:hypothetical protein
MKLKLSSGTSTSAELVLNDGGSHVVTIHCGDAAEDAAAVARAVNTFEALVSALTPFRTTEMGGLLVDIIDMREDGGEDAQKRLSKLISMIDVILDAAEATEQADSAA